MIHHKRIIIEDGVLTKLTQEEMKDTEKKVLLVLDIVR